MKYAVVGTLTAADGSPIEGAEILINEFSSDSQGPVADATSRSDGTFLVALSSRPIQGTRYSLLVTVDDLTLQFDERAKWMVKDPKGHSIPLGDTPTRMDITWPESVPVSGKLRWANGKPAVGVPLDASARGSSQSTGMTKTDSGGRFTFHLVPGKYRLWANTEHGDPAFETVTVGTKPIKGLTGRLSVNR